MARFGRAHGGRYVADAVVALEQAQRLDNTLADVAELLTRARELKAKAARVAIVDDALAVAKSKCESADDLGAAWERLRTIAKGDPLYGRATTAAAALERCRRTNYQVMLNGLRDVMKAQREKFANDYERQLLGEGMDVHVRLGGSLEDRVTIQYVLLNRAWAFKITDGGSVTDGSFLGQLQKIGFKRVTFSDGYDESYSYDLEPTTEEQALADGPLAKPFKL